MTINIDEDNLKDGLLGLVIALVEVIQELLERQAVRRMESGSLSDAEVERLGMALIDLKESLDRIKSDNRLDDAVSSIRQGLDQIAEDLVDPFLDQEEGA
ncbi:MAG: gas vesicle protein K [Methanotrichaceae archaeon]|nr:gas vesicle protein K [Methanotrichaceae archaeon]